MRLFSTDTRRIAFVFTVIFLVISGGCHRNQERSLQRRTFLAMGGIPVEIIVSGLSPERLDALSAMAERNVERWEQALSIYREDSLVNRISRRPDTPVHVSDTVWKALKASSRLYRLSGGAFDITVGPLVSLWKTAEKNQRLPSGDEIHERMSCTGFSRLIFNEKNKTVTWRADGENGCLPSIDVGGMAKGMFSEWIVKDILAALPEKHPIEKLIVNTGGDMYCYTNSPDTTCAVGIVNPFGEGLWGRVAVPRMRAVVTSGTYERFFDIAGKRYCHIINPLTGHPIETSLVSVTVIDPSGAMADGLATTIFVLGEKKGLSIVNSRPGTEAILIRRDGSWTATAGVAPDVEPFRD